jgi:hypothetical protein
LSFLTKIAKALDRRGLWLPLVIESHWYDRLDKTGFQLAVVLKELLGREPSNATLEYRKNALMAPSVELGDPDPPAIDLFLACAGKDLLTLPLAISAAAANVKNPIRTISVVVPDQDRETTQSVLAEALTGGILDRVTISVDSDWLNRKTINDLRQAFGNRFGWILQQIITTNFVLKSASPGVLVINSDTVLTRPKLFLDSKGKQILHRSSEFNEPYYQYLRSLDEQLEVKSSHVTHHMLMQPDLMRAVMRHIGFESIDALGRSVIDFSSKTGQLQFCLEFELYAQFVKLLFPERIIEIKFSNISVSRTDELAVLERQVYQIGRSKMFNSASFHDYLG